MKILSLFATLVLMCASYSFSLFAQKIKNEKMNVNYMMHPEQPFPANMDTYSVNFVGTFPQGERDVVVELVGKKYVKDPKDAHILISIHNVSPFFITQKIESVKHPDDANKTGFRNLVTQKISVYLEVTDGAKTKVYFSKLYTQEHSFRGEYLPTEEEARKFWNKNKQYSPELTKHFTTARNQLCFNAVEVMKKTFGLIKTEQTFRFARITQDKKNTYQAFEIANDSTEKILKKMVFMPDYTAQKNRLSKYYNFWIKAKDSLAKSEDKINKNLVFISCQNAALLSILWEDYDNANNLIKQMETAGIDDDRAKDVRKIFVERKKNADAKDDYLARWASGRPMETGAASMDDPFGVNTVQKETIDPKFNFDENIGFLVTRKGDTTFGYVYKLPETFREDLQIAMITRKKEIVRFLTKDVWSYSVKGEIYRLLDKTRRYNFDVLGNKKFEGVVYDFHILRYSSEKLDFFEDANFTNTYYYYYKDDRSANRFQPMAFASSDKILAECFKVSCPELAKSILAGAYKEMDSKEKNRELAKIVIKEFETKCGTNKNVQESFIIPEKTKKLYKPE